MKCNLCGYEGDFLPMGDRKNAKCPNCKSLERHREFANIVKIKDFDKVYHASPNKGLKSYLSNKCDYSFGYYETGNDLRAIHHLPETFNYIIAIHVLEHIDGDALAISEVYRTLKRGGKFILQVPYEKKLTHDRINIYTKSSIGKKLKKAGFRVRNLTSGEQHFIEATK